LPDAVAGGVQVNVNVGELVSPWMTGTTSVPVLLFVPAANVPAAFAVLLTKREVSSNPNLLCVVSFTVTVRGIGVPGV